MDIFVKSSLSQKDGLPNWDFVVDSKGSIKSLFGVPETQQRAVVSAYLQKGTIPQLATTGVPWLEVLTGTASLLEADASARQHIQELSGSYAHVPVFTTENNKLICTVQEA